MSEIYAECVRIDAIDPHPNADKLEIAKIKGATVVVGKDTFKAGELVVYCPPDLLIPEYWANKFGVTKYLKQAVFPGNTFRTNCRVAATRLRSYSSFGFIVPVFDVFEDGNNTWFNTTDPHEGLDCNYLIDGKKYVPDTRYARIPSADEAPPHPAFHKYTDLQHYWKFNRSIPEGEHVRITEKIHGCNSRVGLVDGELMAGSHRIRRKPPTGPCTFWWPLSVPGVKELVEELSLIGPVVVFGEIFGAAIQDMDYGLGAEELGYRVFDISVRGTYLNYEQLKAACRRHGVNMVPTLYIGPFSEDKLFELRDGPAFAAHNGKFKGREGVVVTPLVERHCEYLNGRAILKSVSADYLDRKGAQDNAEE